MTYVPYYTMYSIPLTSTDLQEKERALREKPPGLSRLRHYHREIARRLALGQRVKDIAKALDMSPGAISRLAGTPLMQAEVQRLEEMRETGTVDVRTQLQELAPTMVEVCKETALFAKSDSLRLSAAQDLLDRAGYNKVHKVDSVHMTETYEQRLQRLLGIKDSGTEQTQSTPTVQIVNTGNDGGGENG